MTVSPLNRRILITGANGFIGRRLTAALLADPAHDITRIALVDTSLSHRGGCGVDLIQGDVTDPSVLDAAIGDGVDLVYHLAAVVGGAAEADYSLARRVNVDATLTLFERLRRTERCPRVVYASSIAVFGEPPPPHVNDDTIARPTLTYGAQKLMMEVALAQFSARGWLDGISLRLPAIVAKPAVTGVEAVFLNRVFHAFAAGEAVTLPVGPAATAWLLSHAACIAALRHAGRLAAAAIGMNRTVTLPALRVTMQDLVDALAQLYPNVDTKVAFAPDARIETQFGSQPPLSTKLADRLGFLHDGTIADLVRNATV